MAKPKCCFKRFRRIKKFSLILFTGFLWLGNAVGIAEGQTTQSQPQPSLPQGAVTFPKLFIYAIKPNTPLKDLLPIPPKNTAAKGFLFTDDLAQIPEVSFQEPLTKTQDALNLTAHTIAKINHLNQQQTDGFMDALLGERSDLAGLPVAMGDTCRMNSDRSQFFTQALDAIRQAKGLGSAANSAALRTAMFMEREAILKKQILEKTATKANGPTAGTSPQPPSQDGSSGPVVGNQVPMQQMMDGRLVTFFTLTQTADPDTFWNNFAKLCVEQNKAHNYLAPTQLEHVTLARIAALIQVLAPESAAMRKGLIKFLAGISHAEATRALAKLAIFTAEDDVRNSAIEALKVRREKDYTDILLQGLHYPLPAVAKRASEAIVKLGRADMVSELVNFLEEPDPRSPILKDMGQKKVPVVRELVRINHHRNCLMCHSPAAPNEVPSQVTTAEVPRPDQPLPSPSFGYNNSIPELLVRLDVTYLRQDFSVMQPVADANPWPEMQRFDFLVRTRTLSEQEAKAFPSAKAGEISPYQRVTLAALRELTGKDSAPTAEAWRKLLNLPRREVRESLE